jgi:alpha-aminoadipic semialdehyde synthase
MNSTDHIHGKVIGIRRENKNKWERRVALIPEFCKKLIEKGIKIIVQPSKLRCFTDKQYKEVGCEINEDLSQAKVILGVKEIPLDFLLENKTFFFFSHTLKGQPQNMPVLRELLKKHIRLVDYECIKEIHEDQKQAQRLVAFGRFAGLAGTIDFLQGLGEFLLHKNLCTPFMHVGSSYMFPSVEEAKKAISNISNMIKHKLFPSELCPFVIGLSGTGRVANGAKEILTLLPHEFVDADELEEIFKDKSKARRDIVYITIIESKHMYRNIETNLFDKKEFYSKPDLYKSIFAPKFVPYLSILIHCIYWDPKSPRILTFDEAYDLSKAGKFRLMGVSDITCDLDGSIEIFQKLTTIEDPFYTYDPLLRNFEDDFEKITPHSMLYHGVDHLPAEFPIDSSNYFSEKLYPFLEKVVEAKYPLDIEECSDLPKEIFNACETCNGKLTPKFDYLYKELVKYYPEYEKNSK